MEFLSHDCSVTCVVYIRGVSNKDVNNGCFPTCLRLSPLDLLSLTLPSAPCGFWGGMAAVAQCSLGGGLFGACIAACPLDWSLNTGRGVDSSNVQPNP